MGFFLRALFVAALAWAAWSLFLRPAPDKWHTGSKWQALLNVYDEMAREQFAGTGCKSLVLPTSFGQTQAYTCGDASHPAVLMLHGAGSNSLIFGDWIVPHIRDRYFAVSVDFVCDAGRSAPLDGDTSKCPQDQAQLAQWVREVVQRLNISAPVSLIGYSYGSFIAASTALFAPELVSKIVLLAPAAVFAPVSNAWMLRAVGYMIYQGPWFFQYMSSDPDFSFSKMTPQQRTMTEAIMHLKSTVLTANPYHFPDEELAKIARKPTMLVIGEEEKVTDPVLAVETAKRNGIEVQLFTKAGHLLLMEHPRKPLVDIIGKFLDKQ